MEIRPRKGRVEAFSRVSNSITLPPWILLLDKKRYSHFPKLILMDEGASILVGKSQESQTEVERRNGKIQVSFSSTFSFFLSFCSSSSFKLFSVVGAFFFFNCIWLVCNGTGDLGFWMCLDGDRWICWKWRGYSSLITFTWTQLNSIQLGSVKSSGGNQMFAEL